MLKQLRLPAPRSGCGNPIRRQRRRRGSRRQSARFPLHGRFRFTRKGFDLRFLTLRLTAFVAKTRVLGQPCAACTELVHQPQVSHATREVILFVNAFPQAGGHLAAKSTLSLAYFVSWLPEAEVTIGFSQDELRDAIANADVMLNGMERRRPVRNVIPSGQGGPLGPFAIGRCRKHPYAGTGEQSCAANQRARRVRGVAR